VSSLRALFCIIFAPSSSATIYSASFRTTFSMCLFRFWTPASRQYQRTMCSIALQSISKDAVTLFWKAVHLTIRLSFFCSISISISPALLLTGTSPLPSSAVVVGVVRPQSRNDFGSGCCSATAIISSTSYMEFV